MPESDKREAQLLYIKDSTNLIENYNIPRSMVLNLHQTPLEYFPCVNRTLAQKSSSILPIKGVSDNLMITEIFTISLDSQILPMHLICSGKPDS